MVAHRMKIKIPGTDLTIWGGPRLLSAAKELNELDLYQVGKMTLIIKEAYRNGKADGAQEVVENVQDALKNSARKLVRRGIARPKRRGVKHGGQLFLLGPRRT